MVISHSLDSREESIYGLLGVYRRHMKVIGYLRTFDRIFGVPATTRNWNTMTTISRVLGEEGD